MKRYLLFMLMVALVSGSIGLAASKPQADAKTAKQDTTQSKQQNVERTGDDVFQANCGRCHRPPMSISQRTTGTIIMHMRARARLSREDEILLLKFMAP
ncbi:hypothetical protein [Edaphobacter aggregans]|uniref:hypothetical protein n=1 Tax=Edaphobacter aggregans TaxID=570835 RepID=UPI000550B05F|nr:hypothetical protein [Edaphobacter aggregans]